MADDDGVITAAGLRVAVDRAVAYRIGVARQAGEPGRLDEAIQGEAASVERARESMDGDGWVEAGVVWDTVADWRGVGLAVRWHPATGRVRVERPGERPSDPPRYAWTSPYSAGGGRYEALPGHRHERGGQPACGPCAVAEATEAETADGWESRPLEPGEAYACARCGAQATGPAPR